MKFLIVFSLVIVAASAMPSKNLNALSDDIVHYVNSLTGSPWRVRFSRVNMRLD